MNYDPYSPRHPLSDDVVMIEGRRLHAVSILGGSLMSAFAFFAAIVFIATLTASAGFDDGGNSPHTNEALVHELSLVTGQMEVLSTSIDNGDIEGVVSPAGATVQMLMDRRAELITQLSHLPPAE